MSSRYILLKHICFFVKSCWKIFILKEKKVKNLVQMPASESLPNLAKVFCTVSFFPSPFKALDETKNVFETVSHMNIPSSTALKYNAHSLSSFKSNCSSESRVCKNNLCMKKSSSLLRRGKEGAGTNLDAFHKRKTKQNKSHKTTPMEKTSEEVTTQGLVHPTAWLSVTKTVWRYSDKICVLKAVQLSSGKYMPPGNFREINCCRSFMAVLFSKADLWLTEL